MKIGIAGTGRMGAAIAARLSGLGHEMMVWNRSADKARATGFKVAETPQALAAGCEAVIERYQLPGYAVGIGSKAVELAVAKR